MGYRQKLRATLRRSFDVTMAHYAVAEDARAMAWKSATADYPTERQAAACYRAIENSLRATNEKTHIKQRT